MSLIQSKQTNLLSKYDNRIAYACALYFIMSVLNATVKVVLPDSSIVSYMSVLSGCVILTGYILSIREVLKRNSTLFLKSYILFAALYFFSYCLISVRGESVDLMISGSAFLTFSWWIPLGVFVVSIYDKRILYDVLLKTSFILLTLLTIMFIYHPLTIYDEFGYNMFFGFNLVLPTIIHLNELIKNKKIKYSIVVLAEFAMLLVYGNRGVWIPIMFFIAYRLFISPQGLRYKRIIISAGIGLLVVSLSAFFFTYVSSYLEEWGISSRTLELIMSGEMASYKSGRDEIWAVTKEMILDKPILGWGLGGEFYYLAQSEGAIADASFTPHNGILQNIVNFGLFGGIFASIVFVIPYFRLPQIKDEAYYDLCLIFGSVIVANFYSASGFFIKPNCAIFIYLFYNYRKWDRMNHTHKQTNNS